MELLSLNSSRKKKSRKTQYFLKFEKFNLKLQGRKKKTTYITIETSNIGTSSLAIASQAGVFRGARLSSLPTGEDE